MPDGRFGITILIVITAIFGTMLVLTGIRSMSTSMTTASTAYVIYPTPYAATPYATMPYTTIPYATKESTPIEPMLHEASQRAFDRITELLQQPNYTGYEWKQSFDYNTSLLIHHGICELESYRLQDAVDSQDLPLVQRRYIELNTCIID